MKKLCYLFLLFGPLFIHAQVTVDWLEFTGGVSIALDANNQVYTLDYVYNPGGDMVLTKRDSDGNLLWQTSYDQTDNTRWERAAWVEVDHDGNVIVVGTSMSGYSNPVVAASIIMKFSSSGTLLWRHIYESNFEGSSARKCLVDNANNIYVLGLGMGPNGLVTKVKKFAPTGTSVWSYFDAAGIGQGVNLKLTPDNHLLITSRTTTGNLMGYTKLNLNGSAVWTLSGVASPTVGDAAGDAAGNTYCVSGENTLSNAGTVIRKLSPSGTQLWTQTYAGISGFRVEVGTDNMPVVSGFPSPGSGGAAFLKTDAQGNQLWLNNNADGPNQFLLHAQMKMDQYNHSYLAAGILGQMGVCKVNNDGTTAWYQTMSSGAATGFCIGTDYNVYVVGGTTVRLGQTLGCGIPTQLAVSNQTPVAATLQWLPVSGATAYQVQYRTVGAPNWQTASATTPSLSLSGLMPSTLYEFRVSTSCGSNNTSDWSQSLRFTTLALPCDPPAVGALYANNLTTTSAWLNCSLSGMISYDWRYRVAGSNNWIDLPASAAPFIPLTGLTHSTTYQYQSSVQCNVNWSDWSATQMFTTDTPPCTTPTTAQLVISDITPSSARLHCTMTPVDLYDWRYRAVGSNTWIDLPASSNNFINLSGLAQFTTYECQVAVQCQGVWTDWSAANSFTTTGVCAAPSLTHLLVTNLTASSARLNCSLTGVSAYDWQYRQVGALTWVQLPTTSLNFTDISGLAPNVAYEFQVSVACGMFWSDWSENALFSTGTVPCPLPDVSQLAAANITSTSATLHCTLTDVDNYDWRYRILGTLTWTELPTTPAGSFVLNGLAPSTQYEFQVAVQCATTWTAWSQSKLFVTLDALCSAPNLGQLFVSNLTSTSARLNCTMNNVDAYDWRYKSSSASGWTDLAATTVNYSDVSGLSPLSQYEYQVAVLCGGVWSLWSSATRFITPSTNLVNQENTPQHISATDQVNLSLYPVPAKHEININYHLNTSAEVIITIVSASGQQVLQQTLGVYSSGPHTHNLSLQALAPGIYFMKLQAGQGTPSIQRFIKSDW